MENYINREKALKKLTQLEIDKPNFTMTDVKMALMEMPLADVVFIDKYKEVCKRLDFMKSRCKNLKNV